jgi:hypothetical protein
MKRPLPLWVVLSGGAAVFIGCGIFFALQDLGTVNDYATIASFFLALATGIGSLVSFVRPKQEQATATPAEQSEQPTHGATTVVFGNPGIYQVGNRNKAIHKKTYIYGAKARKEE